MTKFTLKNITDETLISYVDGELSSKEMEEVSALISQSASLKLRVDNHQDLSTQLKTFFSEGMDDTPDYIATKIHNLVDTYEESKDNSSLFSNVITYVGNKITPSWDNFNGLTKVAAGVAVGVIASPYLFDKDINTSFIVKQQQENFIEKKIMRLFYI